MFLWAIVHNGEKRQYLNYAAYSSEESICFGQPSGKFVLQLQLTEECLFRRHAVKGFETWLKKSPVDKRFKLVKFKLARVK